MDQVKFEDARWKREMAAAQLAGVVQSLLRPSAVITIPDPVRELMAENLRAYDEACAQIKGAFPAHAA